VTAFEVEHERELFARFKQTGDIAIRNELAERHRGLAITLARRFNGRGEPMDDLLQVAMIALLRAIERFEPERGNSFTTFATPTVLGELRRLLKPAGVLRLALPDVDKGIRAYLAGEREHFLVPDEDVASLGGKFVVHMLWYGWTMTMFTPDFIEELLRMAGFVTVHHVAFKETCSRLPGITDLDNREEESLFVEAVKQSA
jgi:RNA polymerase sigma factor (sigma-70 family)